MTFIILKRLADAVGGYPGVGGGFFDLLPEPCGDFGEKRGRDFGYVEFKP